MVEIKARDITAGRDISIREDHRGQAPPCRSHPSVPAAIATLILAGLARLRRVLGL